MILLLVISSASCGDGYDGVKCYESVQKTYPNSTIFRVPTSNYRFIVVGADSSVHYVETLGSGVQITVDLLIKKI